jgi:hypothetical protein
MAEGLSLDDLTEIERQVSSKKRSILVAYICLLLGWPVSAHRLYLNCRWTAIMQILSYFLLVGFFWLLLDAYMLPFLVRRFPDEERERLRFLRREENRFRSNY